MALMAAAAIFSCQKEEEVTAQKLSLPAQTYDYTSFSNLPESTRSTLRFSSIAFSQIQLADSILVVDGGFFGPFDPADGTIQNPVITNDGATLGRVLFYDKKMSINNATACASCHHQENAFADPTAGSVGFGGKVTPRNSMAIVNVALNQNLFWDSRVQSAKELTLKPVQNHIEMGMEDLDVLVEKLSKTDYYPALFSKAFGDDIITEERISNALAQFLCSMVSMDSKFDNQFQSTSALNELEQLGQGLFFSERTKCFKCHSGQNFAADDRPGGEYGGDSFGGDGGPKGTANTGLDAVTSDPGFENGQFRIPSLRNIALTAPYMHDGRFKTLEEVVDFYDHGVKAHPNLDKKLVGNDGEPVRLNLTPIEKKALVAFLGTLTDQSLMNDAKFSSPFK